MTTHKASISLLVDEITEAPEGAQVEIVFPDLEVRYSGIAKESQGSPRVQRLEIVDHHIKDPLARALQVEHADRLRPKVDVEIKAHLRRCAHLPSPSAPDPTCEHGTMGCLMPSDHMEDECHTFEMVDAYEAGALPRDGSCDD